MYKKSILVLSMLMCLCVSLSAQQTVNDQIGRDAPNSITTTVPFLMIAPDTRAGGLGDAGVATTPDVNSMHWNPAKYSFIEDDMGVAISYTPWLREMVSDMNLAYISGYKKIDKENIISASLRYFDLGSIQFRDEYNQLLQDFSPNEFAIDLGYSRLLGEKFSGSVAMRFIYSNLTGGQSAGTLETSPGKSVAADISFYYYDTELIKLAGLKSTFMAGVNISNIGAKISYSEEYQDFIPQNFRLGAGYKVELDSYNSLMLTVDVNKLLVPTPPVYYQSGETLPDGTTVTVSDEIIKHGKDPNVSIASALFTSWADAPGVATPFVKNGQASTFREEMAEFTVSTGLEYWYDNQFAFRVGYFNEHEYKGNRKYFTFGAGLKMNVFGLDFSYLVPTTQNNPLQNTFRFTLNFNLGALMDEASAE